MPETITRGATVIFAVNFTDANGDIANPLSADLHIAYRRNKQMQHAVVALSQSGNTWSAAWESSVADQCQVDWHVRSVGQNVSALQGAFKLETNRANPSS